MSTKWYAVLEDFNENFHVDQLHSMILLLEQRAENSTFSNHRSGKGRGLSNNLSPSGIDREYRSP